MHLQRYGLAVVSVGVALAAALLLQHFHFRDAAVPLLLFAVAITAWYGGPGPAVLAVVLSLMSVAYFFVPPLYSLYIAATGDPVFHYLCLIRCTHHVVRHDSATCRGRASSSSRQARNRSGRTNPAG